MALPESGPYLKAALICESVIEEKDGVLSLIRVVDRFILSAQAQGGQLPAEMPAIPLKMNVVLMMTSGSARGSHNVTLDLEDPSGLSVQRLSTVSVLFEGEDRGCNVITQMQLVLKLEGLYWILVRMDDEFFTRIPVRIVFARQSTGGGLLPPPGPTL